MNGLSSFWNQEKWFLGKVVTPLLLVFILYQVLIYPLITDVAETRSEIERLSQRTFSEEWFKEEIRKVAEDIDVLQRANTRLASQIVPKESTVYNESVFRKLAEATGLSVEKVQTSKEIKELVVHEQITLTMDGSYRNFIEYLKKLEQKAPLAVVTDFTIKKTKSIYVVNALKIEYLRGSL